MDGRKLSIGEALQNAEVNDLATWNHSKSSAERSERPKDASNRIFDGFGRVLPAYDGPRLKRASGVFAMGSCFAREIEKSLMRRGCNVTSMDDRIQCPEFNVSPGTVRTSFFNRLTPFAIYQEFQQAFGEAEGWDERTLLIEHGEEIVDLNYWNVGGADTSLAATLTRRRLAAELVRQAVEADVVILTLGVTESWVHKPSDFHANKVPAQTLIRHRDEFELHFVSFAETQACLQGIRALIARHRSTPFQLVVTVSPTPLGKTFTAHDLIVANMNSKSTLRAAAAEFCERTPDAHYFPSYEMVTYSDPQLVWRPDRTHVEPAMFRHIINTFTRAYYEPGELAPEKLTETASRAGLPVSDGNLRGGLIDVNIALLREMALASKHLEEAMLDSPPI